MADPNPGTEKVRSGGPSELAKAEERTALWLLIPTFVIILVIAFYPLGQVFVESFRQREFASGDAGRWVGLQNYQRLLSVTVRELPIELDDAGEPVIEDGAVQYESWVRVLPREPQRYRAEPYRRQAQLLLTPDMLLSVGSQGHHLAANFFPQTDRTTRYLED